MTMRGLVPSTLLALALALPGPGAQASVGLRTLPGTPGDGPVTVFYPAAAPSHETPLGPFRFNVAADAAPVAGNRRLVVLSHGSGGAPWVHADLAQRLVEAGFVVAMPEHQGDNWHDLSEVGPGSWKRRPLEVSRAIDAVARDPRLAALLALDRVGMFGMSAGGHAALTLAGGRWSPAQLLRHCEDWLDQDFATCAGPATRLTGGWLDGAKRFITRQVLRQRLADSQWYQHHDPRIAAIVAEVPFAADFDLASLTAPVPAVALVQAARDRWLQPRFHSAAVLQACRTCTLLVDHPQAGHGSFMSPQPPAQELSETLAWLLGDPPEFDRRDVVQVHGRIVEFLRQHLLP